MRQYIGARYVPKFYEGSNGSNWDSGVEYEPLTIVQYLTNTYCSKKTVPSTVGAPNLNQEYWANIGLLGEIQTDISNLQTDVSNLEDSVDTLDDKIDTEVGRIDGNVDDIEDDINFLKHRRIIFVGDSYAVVENGWIDTVISRLNLGSGNAYKVAAGSRGFIGDTTQQGDMTWLTLLQNAASSIDSPNTITDVIVCGGSNDVNQTLQALNTAIGNFRNYVRTTYPNANLCIGFIGRRRDATSGNIIGTCCYIYKQCCAFGNITYLVNSECCWGRKSSFTDNVHPNSYGENFIASCICNYVKCGVGIPFNIINTSNMTLTNGIFASGTLTAGSITQIASNGMCTFVGSGMFAVSFDNAITFNLAGGSWQTIANIEDPIVPGNGFGVSEGHVLIRDTATNQFRNIPCLFRIYDGKVQIMINEKNTDFSDVSVNINYFRAAIPAITMDMVNN